MTTPGFLLFLVAVDRFLLGFFSGVGDADVVWSGMGNCLSNSSLGSMLGSSGFIVGATALSRTVV